MHLPSKNKLLFLFLIHPFLHIDIQHLVLTIFHSIVCLFHFFVYTILD